MPLGVQNELRVSDLSRSLCDSATACDHATTRGSYKLHSWSLVPLRGTNSPTLSDEWTLLRLYKF